MSEIQLPYRGSQQKISNPAWDSTICESWVSPTGSSSNLNVAVPPPVEIYTRFYESSSKRAIYSQKTKGNHGALIFLRHLQ